MSQVTLRIPAPLLEFTGGRDVLQLPGDSVRDVLAAAGEGYPGLESRILTPEGQRRPFVNIFVGETNVRQLQDLDTPVKDGDEIHVIAAVAGG